MLPQFESPFLNGIKEPLRNVYGRNIFPRMMEHFSNAMEKTAREQFIEYVTKMDEDFRYSKGRSDNYYVKDNIVNLKVTKNADHNFTNYGN